MTAFPFLVAAVVILVTGIAYCLYALWAREGFASEQARMVTAAAEPLFRGGATPSYEKYRGRVPGADPVQFDDVRRLAQSGRLTAENVDRVL